MSKGSSKSNPKPAAKEAQKTEELPGKKATNFSKLMIDPLLIEIGIESWKDLATGRDALQKYLEQKYGNISKIFPDSGKPDSKGHYLEPESMDYRVNPVMDLELLNPEIDVLGINRDLVKDDLKKRKDRNLKYEINRIHAYNAIRSTLSLVLDEILEERIFRHTRQRSDCTLGAGDSNSSK